MTTPSSSPQSDRKSSPQDAYFITKSTASILIVLVLGGFLLVYLKGILVPIVLAILLSFLLQPLIVRFNRWGLSDTLSVISAQCIAVVIILGGLTVFSLTVGPLSRALPKYRNALVHEMSQVIEWTSGHISSPKAKEALKQEINDNLLPQAIDQGVKVTQKGLKTTTSIVGYFFLTLLISTFLLLEATRLREKLTEAYREDHPILKSMTDIGADVRAYVIAKTLISLLTGFCVWILLALCGVDFAVFWGLLAFPLNFIPTVGAVVASFPPILVALIDPNLGPLSLSFVIIGLVLINGFIGSVIDPQYVGQTVKLSPLVVFLSMLLWGIIWGPVGMILAVPIMVSIKVIFSHTPGLESIATMMRG